MAAGTYNIKLEQGVTRSFSGQYMQPNGTTPKNLTGFLGRGAIKISKADCDVLAELNVVVTNALEGRFEVSIPAAALTGKRLRSKRADGLVETVYDVELYTANDATVIRVLEGTALVSLEVTK